MLDGSVYIFTKFISRLVDKALACQKAEHEYADMPCGIMDQFIAILAKKDHALLIDCRYNKKEFGVSRIFPNFTHRSVTYTLIPFAMTNVVILTTNSGVKHELTGSEYPTRKKQSQQAAMLLKKLSLRDATLEDIECKSPTDQVKPLLNEMT